MAKERVRRRAGRAIRPVQQSAAAECGLACAAMMLQQAGTAVELQELRDRYDVTLRGATLKTIMDVLGDHGMLTRPMSVGINKLCEVKLPAILHWSFDHFVVLEACRKDGYVIVDPACGRRVIPFEQADRLFTGIVLEPISSEAKPRSPSSFKKLSLVELMPRLSAIRGDLLQVLAITIALNAVALALPLFLKVLFERAFPSGSTALLVSLTLAFFVLALLQGLTRLVRGFSLMRLRRKLSDNMSGQVFSDLVWLNNAVVERRAAGTIATNYRSIFTLSDTLSEDLMAAVVDGLSGVVVLVILLAYDLPVGLAAIAAIAAYAALVALTARETKSRLRETLFAESREGGFFVETINRLQTIRLFRAETWRMVSFSNLHGNVEDARQRHSEFTNMVRALGEGLLQGAWVFILAIAAMRVLSGEISTGLFAAIVVWLGLAFARARETVTRAAQLESLETHVDRIADIVRNKSDRPDADGAPRPAPCALRSLGCETLGFRYGENGPWLFRDCDLSVRAGEWVTIVGRSGEGKSTLVKVLTGLLPATEGAALLNGGAMGRPEFDELRRMMGVVMQNDGLFGGSMKDNITLFDTTPDFERMQQCAALAEIGDDIGALPMKYDSLIGEQGAGLSAGQQQRLMLARALYRRPSILILDEFSANLDQASEAAILANLRRLGLAVIAVAHRPQVIAVADRVLELSGGTLRPWVPLESRATGPNDADDAGLGLNCAVGETE